MDEDGFNLSTARVAIVGLGLMGASLAMDLRDHCAEIIGVSRSPETMKYALEYRIVDRIADFDSALDCDLLILAAPVRTIIQQLQKMCNSSLSNPSSRPTIVVDLGSTKTEIVDAMQSLPVRFDPIGGHPMCGKEVAGIQHAETNLYRDRIFVLTPLERTTKKALALVEEMINVIGGVPLVLTPKQQDALVAMTSHLPYLVASILMLTALSKDDEQLWTMAASGFRDTTRLAASDLTMMIDILLTNRDAILEGLDEYHSNLENLTTLIKSADENQLRAILAPTQQKRSQLFKQAI
jgi:prephenate dehydrogenase